MHMHVSIYIAVPKGNIRVGNLSDLETLPVKTLKDTV